MLASHKGGNAAGYLLRDLFTDAQSAPITTPRICKPGPGTLTMIQTSAGTGNSISGGKYLRPRPTGTQAYTNDGCYAPLGFSRRNGLMAYTKLQSATIDRIYPVAWGSAAALTDTPAFGPNMNSTALLQIQCAGGGLVPFGTSLSANTDYQVAVIARGNGYLYLIQGGTQFPSWTLLWVDAADVVPVLYFESANFNADAKTSALAVLQKAGALATEFGKTALFAPIVNAGDTQVGLADGLTFFVWTPVAAETLSLYFRRTDDNNCYRLDCAQAGGTIKLFRRVAGVDTELASGKTQTWTTGIAKSYRIGIVHVAGEIRTFVQAEGAGVIAKHVVTAETFNLAATGVKYDGFVAGANLAVWPRTFSGTNEVDLA